MSDSLQGRPDSVGHWYSTQMADTPVRAYMARDEPSGPNLTIFWQGYVEVLFLAHVLGQAEHLFRNTSALGRLTAYGPTRESVERRTWGLANELASFSIAPAFEAFRAEIISPEEKFVLWANVTNTDESERKRPLDENIGICVTTNLFSRADTIITGALSYTAKLPPLEAARAVEHLWKKALRSH